ncbi:hypothetical protein [Chryseobacterium sp. RLHN22]|uniref:hypothetical protein n=1 Tax=Chryseobacterium sp. RLHN22 TaxID=3437885 RepID=UPI003D9AF1F6
MKNLILVTLLLSSFLFKSQIGSEKDWKIIGLILSTRIEATSIDNKAFFSFGPKIPINENNYVSLRGYFNWWDLPDRKFIVIPELDYFRKVATFEGDKNMIKHLYAGAGITPNTVSPKFGINFYYFFTAELGYNFEYKTYKYFPTEGFRFSFGVNLVF